MRTQLYEFHKKNGKIVEFAGFLMPLWYKSINKECDAVRSNVGLFDISHMGRTFITGIQAQNFLDYLTTNDVSALEPHHAHYTVFTNESGGIIDDLVILKIEKNNFLVVYNANNRNKDLKWLKKHAIKFKVNINPISNTSAMIAIQGPKASQIMSEICKEEPFKISRFECDTYTINNTRTIVSGTGYTGEEGFEIIIPETTIDNTQKAFQVWNKILETGEKHNILPCGLASRDILRLEAGMCLYGNDINEETTPFEANIGFVVKFKKESDFIGKSYLENQKTDGLKRIRTGFKMMQEGIPRPGYEILKDGLIIGKITSGTFSPTLKKGIAMGYIDKAYSIPGKELMINIRGKSVKAEVTKMPFYDSKIYGWRRTIDK